MEDDGDGDGDGDGDVSSMAVDEGPPPTDLYFTEEEDALYGLYVRSRRRRKRKRRRRRTRLEMETDGFGDGAVPASGVAIAYYLPETTAGEARESVEECAVCLDEYEAGDEPRTMPCGHGFHGHCIVEWLRASPSRLCPLCRFEVPREEDTDTGDEEDEREAGHGDDNADTGTDNEDERDAGHDDDDTAEGIEGDFFP